MIENIRIWPSPESTRMVLDLSGPVEHKAFMLRQPERIVLDLDNARMNADTNKLSFDKTPIRRVRSALRAGGSLRVVLDLSQSVRMRSFLLKPNSTYGYRLVVDLEGKETAAPTPVKTLETLSGKRDVIVAIDAGHGGEDPGAIGPGRLREKDVVLSIARKLQAEINRKQGFKAILTRKGDYFIPLRKRTQLARERGADLFVSIHADAFTDPRAAGASVFTLSRRGASSSMARFLAETENQSDLIGGVDGGVSLEDKDDLLKTVLVDLSQTSSMNFSDTAGRKVLSRMRHVAHLHKPTVEKAGFVVLKIPDIPSILVETGFISNPGEARKLKQSAYQSKLARAVAQGVVDYFDEHPVPGTWLAWQKDLKLQKQAAQHYRVRRGDTLTAIAQRNRTTVAELKAANQLRSDQLRVGQLLRIPSS
ncbi:MAG: AMIN domain-containing protein [Gammaproteobacteria bacterium]|nr:MAG: AMIN domain-containing protein [Gammaproteobacteria bacterium]